MRRMNKNQADANDFRVHTRWGSSFAHRAHTAQNETLSLLLSILLKDVNKKLCQKICIRWDRARKRENMQIINKKK